MATGLGHEVAEAAHELETHRLERERLRVLETGAQARVQVGAFVLEAEEPGLVVDPRHPVAELVVRDPAVLSEQARRPLDGVAKAHDPKTRKRRAPGEDGHGVGVLQDKGPRAQLGHVLYEAVEDREVAQAAEDPAWPQGVADALAHPVAFRDGYVELPLGGAAHLDGDDHVVGPLKGLATISGGDDPRRRLRRLGHPAHEPFGTREPVGVDVHEHDLALAELGKGEDVPREVPREHHTSRSDEDDSHLGLQLVRTCT